MRVRDAMSTSVLSVGPTHTVRQAAEMMIQRNVGSAVVMDPDAPAPGIITERDVMRCVAGGVDVDAVKVDQHHIDDLAVASPDWTLDEAADAMKRGGFRHLVVMEDDRVVGVVSMRDIVAQLLGEPG